MNEGRVAPASSTSTTEPSASGPWETPVPLDRRGDLPPFPLDALPNWQAAFVEAEATATQTPPDMAGVFVLGATAAMVQGHARVEPFSGWVEELAPFFVVLLPPGERKSGVHRDVTAPVVDLERTLVEETRGKIAEAHADRKVLEKRLESAQKTAAGKRSDPELEEQVRVLARELDDLPVPVSPRISADDVTPEALSSLLADHGAISILSAEGGIFDLMTGRYSNGHPNLDVFLKGHAGDPLRVDRRGRPPEVIPRPVLSMCLAAQPYVIEKASQSADLGQRGLFDRFGYSLPLSRVGHREIEPPPVPAQIERDYQAWMLDLGRSMRALGPADPLTLRASEEARAVLTEWRAALEPRRRPDGDLGHVQGLASKLDGLVVRLAGLLHLSETLRQGFERPISGETMANATRLGDYFLDHGLAVYELIGADPALGGARRLLAWITKEQRSSFSKRDAHAGNRSVFQRADHLDAALTLLERHGWIRERENASTPKPQGGRPPSPVFEVNPLSTEPTEDTQPRFAAGSVGSVGSVLRGGSPFEETPSLPSSFGDPQEVTRDGHGEAGTA